MNELITTTSGIISTVSGVEQDNIQNTFATEMDRLKDNVKDVLYDAADSVGTTSLLAINKLIAEGKNIKSETALTNTWKPSDVNKLAEPSNKHNSIDNGIADENDDDFTTNTHSIANSKKNQYVSYDFSEEISEQDLITRIERQTVISDEIKTVVNKMVLSSDVLNESILVSQKQKLWNMARGCKALKIKAIERRITKHGLQRRDIEDIFWLLLQSLLFLKTL